MKQVAQNYRSGDLSVIDVPVPVCKPGGVLVRSLYSLISTGTEVMKVAEGKLSLLGKARARPDQVRRVADSVAQLGPVGAYKKAMDRLDSLTPLGYSVCGVVTEVGDGADEFTAGDLVACAGNEHALHAEVNWVPTNLCVKVPDGVDPRAAAFATVGAIAMHGVRRADVQLGETACVVGLGLVGQLVVQLLVAAGVRVVGVDPLAERCALAEASGASMCCAPDPEAIDLLERALATWTGGIGVDHVLLASSGSSTDPVHLAARLARDRAAVVDIGKTNLDLPWNDYYEKELDVRFSRSYGPGRYDDRYELDGIDYPPGYVRWTERRNLACFVDLVARGRLTVDSLVSEVFPVTEAVEVYDGLSEGTLEGVGFLFEYPRPPERAEESSPPSPASDERSLAPAARRSTTGALRLGFVGAGKYASSMLLPHLSGLDGVELARVVTTTSLSAVNAQRKFGFAAASANAAEVLDDASIDAVFIVTRHSTHAALVCEALEHGKTVFVEKPLALTQDELDSVLKVVAATGNDRVMVGFNRRFAPLLVELRRRFGPRRSESVVRYHVNAGTVPRDSWYARSETEGSRFEGEGGHFIDVISWWLGAHPAEVNAISPSGHDDDLLIDLQFDDGSIANIAYTTTGSRRYPKETLDVSAGGRTARLDNFRRASLWTGRRRRPQWDLLKTDKGQRGQLVAFLDAVRSEGPMPIDLPSIEATTRATFAASRSRATGRVERV